MRKILISFILFVSFFFVFAPQTHAQTLTYGNVAVVTAGYIYKYFPTTTGRPLISTITYCGQQMTRVNYYSGYSNASEIWKLNNAPAGNCEVRADFNAVVKEKNLTSIILKNIEISSTNSFGKGVSTGEYKSIAQSLFVSQNIGNQVLVCSLASHPEGGLNVITPFAPSKIIASKQGQLLYHATGLSVRKAITTGTIGLGWRMSIGTPTGMSCGEFKLNPASTLVASAPDATPVPTPTPTTSPTQGIQAQYYDNPDLTAAKGSVKEPAPGVYITGNYSPGGSNLTEPTSFSASWNGFLRTTYNGSYVFHVQYDDAMRLFINDQLVINKWTDNASGGVVANVTSNPIVLQANTQYKIRAEMYNKASLASFNLKWQNLDFHTAAQFIPSDKYNTVLAGSAPPPVITPPTPTPTPTPTPVPSTPPAPTPTSTPTAKPAGLTGKYYNNTDFTSIVTTRTDPRINFNWGIGAPATNVGVNTFSVRWTGFVKTTTAGTYKFYITSDDGARVFVNGVKIIDDWTAHAQRERSGTISLQGNRYYALRVDYYDNSAEAVAILKWTLPGQTTKAVIPATYLFH